MDSEIKYIREFYLDCAPFGIEMCPEYTEYDEKQRKYKPFTELPKKVVSDLDYLDEHWRDLFIYLPDREKEILKSTPIGIHPFDPFAYGITPDLVDPICTIAREIDSVIFQWSEIVNPLRVIAVSGVSMIRKHSVRILGDIDPYSYNIFQLIESHSVEWFLKNHL